MDETRDVSQPHFRAHWLSGFSKTTATFLEFARTQDISLLHKLQLRYFSPSEILRISHFLPIKETRFTTFVWPSNVSEKTKYRLLGNSVNVDVIRRLLDFLLADYT
jgi:tRNA (cytosine38-C5)-methyltransferase